MQTFGLFLTFALLAFDAVVNATAVAHPEKRQAGCNADNVVRGLRAQPSEASSLCFSLIFFEGTTTVTVPVAGATPV